MPSSVIEFEEDTAFERLVLARAMPLLPTSQASVTIDLRGPGISIGVTPVPAKVRVAVSDTTGSADGIRVADLRPLIFGAAWKVLDLLVEYALESASIPPTRQIRRRTFRDLISSVGLSVRRRRRFPSTVRYDIRDKSGKARAGNVPPVAPLNSHRDLWSRMMNLYGSTSTLRHSLVHRQLKVDPTTGRMEGVAKPGERPPKPLAADEATAFCRAVQGVAAAVIEGALSLRQRDQLTWLLDQLTTHHGQRVLGGIAVHGVVPTVVADAASVSPEEVAIDTGHLKARAKAASPQATHFDLILHLPDGRILAGALEDAREGPLTLKVDSPPDWLRWA